MHEQMSMKQLRRMRNVPAKRGGRIRYTGASDGVPRMGTIKSAKNGYLRILIDGQKHAAVYHPTWKIEYL